MFLFLWYFVQFDANLFSIGHHIQIQIPTITISSMNDQTITPFTKPTVQSPTTGHTIIATSSHSKTASSNKYNHTDSQSLAAENSELFMAIFDKFIIDYVLFDKIFDNTMLHNTMIDVLYLLFGIIFITGDGPIITLIDIWYTLI